MKVNQREIVEPAFPVRNGQILRHPALVISVQEVLDAEDVFYAVMLSTKETNEDFIFELLPEMLTMPSEKRSFVKCQLLDKFRERDVIAKFGSMKQAYFKELLQQINLSVFGNECR